LPQHHPAPPRPAPPTPLPYQALKAEAARQRAGSSTSVYGYDDALRALHPFLRRWRDARREHPGLRAYIVAADISRAFDTGAPRRACGGKGPLTLRSPFHQACRRPDHGPKPTNPATPTPTSTPPSVDIQRLLEVVEPLLASPAYTLVRFCEASPALGCVRVRHASAAVPCEPAAFPGFPDWLRTACRAGCSTVYSDRLPHQRLGRADALALLREHLTRHLLRIRGRWYRQTCGIAQARRGPGAGPGHGPRLGRR
jgi:hypothetical protein